MKQKSALLLLLFLPSLLFADAGKVSKPSILKEETLPPVSVQEVEEDDRVCGWSNYSFSHMEGGGGYNFGVSSFGSGVWGPGYTSYPIQKTVYVSEYSCSPKPYQKVITKEGGN